MTGVALENAPLERADEAPIDPGCEIVDAHHHLDDSGSPSHAYSLAQFTRDAEALSVAETIFVECAFPRVDPVQEVAQAAQWSRESAGRPGPAITGIIGFVDLRGGSEVGATLDAMARTTQAGPARLVGIRHGASWDPAPEIRNHRTNPGPGLYGDPAFREGVAELTRRGLVFDAWVYHPQLADVVALADAIPDARIVVDHLGGPLGVGPYRGRAEEVDDAWRSGMEQLAERDNVRLKIGGIGFDLMVDTTKLAARPNSMQLATYWGPRVRWAIERFGADRCMFESNYPADRGVCGYTTIWNALALMAADVTADAKADLFCATARRTYLA